MQDRERFTAEYAQQYRAGAKTKEEINAAYDRQHRDMEDTFGEMVLFAFKWLLAFTIASIPFDLATLLIIRVIT